MGDLWIQVLTRNERDRARLGSEARAKALREDIVGYRMMLRDVPGDPALHESLAKSHLQVGNLDEALRHVKRFYFLTQVLVFENAPLNAGNNR